MNIKKKIIFTGLSLLLSNTFNGAYSADGADGDETNQPKDPSHKRSFDTMTKSDGPGAAGGAGQSSEGLAETSSNAPREWEQHFSGGITYLDQGDFPEAIAQFSAALAIEGIDEKTRARGLNWLGYVYYKQGDFPEAIAQYTAVLSIEGIDGGTRADGLNGLGDVYYNQGNFSEAIAQYTAVLSIEGIHGKIRASGLNRLGSAYFKQKNYSEAIAQFTAALAIEGIDEKTRAEGLNRLGYVYFEQGSFPEAITQYSAALAIEGIDGETRARCLNKLGIAYFKQRNFPETIAQMRAALATEGIDGETRASCLGGLGSSYCEQKKYSEAITQYTAALVIEEIHEETRANCLHGLGLSYFNLGNEYGKQKNYSEAIAQLRLASVITPDLVSRGLQSPWSIKLLMHAVDTESQENARFLLDNGVAIEAKATNGETALMRAKSGEMVQLLLARGADVNAQDNNGKTALIHAAIFTLPVISLETFRVPHAPFTFTQRIGKIDILLARGANVNAQDNNGNTAFMNAVITANIFGVEETKLLVSALISRGAKIDIQNAVDNNTVLDLCESYEQSVCGDLIQFILDAHQQYSSRGIDLKQEPHP